MIGIIGGTGLYQMDELQVTEVREVTTPFGPPSAPIVLGMLQGRNVAFLARHGLHHDLLPSEVNYRGNIWALKSLGVRTILGVSAVGSLREDIRPGDLALPSQYLDFTKGLRASTFFGARAGGPRVHGQPDLPLHHDPGCQRGAGAGAHRCTRTRPMPCIEGPRFGTRAESNFLRNSGADLVGMTSVPEVFLAVEAQLGYCTIGVATDYDCWLDDPAHHVSAVEVAKLFRGNLESVQQLLANVVADVSGR